MACVFKTWRRMGGWGVGGWGVGGGPDWGKCQPVGSFEMEVTSSGLKKNCQAGPPGLGWPLGPLHWPPGPSPLGPQPCLRDLQPHQWALLAQHWPGTSSQAQALALRPRCYERPGLGPPGGAQEVCLLPSVSGLQCRVPR